MHTCGYESVAGGRERGKGELTDDSELAELLRHSDRHCCCRVGDGQHTRPVSIISDRHIVNCELETSTAEGVAST